MEKEYIYEINCDVVKDTCYATAKTPIEACSKFIKYWLEDQGREISPSSITNIKRIGEVIN